MGQFARPSPKALIVENDREERYLAAVLLEESNMAVVEVSSAEEALAYLQERGEEVAMLFTAVHLSRLMSGADLARVVKLEWPWIRVVVTDRSQGADPHRLPEGVTYLKKPWIPLAVLMEAERAARRGNS